LALVYKSALGSCGKKVSISSSAKLVVPKKIHIGDNCKIAENAVLSSECDQSELSISNNCVIGRGVFIDFTGGAEIGPGTEFSEDSFVYTHDHAHENFRLTYSRYLKIGSHVRIGAKAIVLSSVRSIGDGAIIGAGSVVTKQVPPFVVMAGNPARIVKELPRKYTN